MTIRNSWHLSVYKWWYKNKYGFPNERGYSNLCPYMRAVMFWAPLRALFGTWVRIKGIPLNVFTLPAIVISLPFLLGYISYNAKMTAFGVYLVLTSVCVLASFLLGTRYLLSKDGKDITRGLRTRVQNSGFTDLLAAYFRSAHDRVCPEISWKEN